MFRAIGLSTRGRRSPTVVSPAAAAGANNVEGARASEEDPLAADDINNDDSSVESLTAAARNPEAADAAAQRARTQVAATAAVAVQQHVPNNEGNQADLDTDFGDNCPITLEPPLDPVTFDGNIHVYSRRALVTWMEREGDGEAISHPLTRVVYPVEEFVEMMMDVTGVRRERIMSERRRLGLPLTADAGVNRAR